jgi:hypothetical protein
MGDGQHRSDTKIKYWRLLALPRRYFWWRSSFERASGVKPVQAVGGSVISRVSAEGTFN